MASELGEKILKFLDNRENSINSIELAQLWGEEHQKIVGVIKSLQSLGDVITAEQVSSIKFQLSSEGESIVKEGSHEALVFELVPPEGISNTELMRQAGPNGKIGMSKAIKSGWLKIKKEGKETTCFRAVDSIEDKVKNELSEISKNLSSLTLDTDSLNEYKKRKLIQQSTVNSFNIGKGSDFKISIEKLETDLTPEMLANKEWKTRKFKNYNFNALGTPISTGHLHPLLKVRSEFRQIFLEMGFTEMPTNQYVDSCFWNFDALFVPQKHPARDAQDTFYISQPKFCNSIPEDYMQNVAKVHSKGDYGSRGYRYEWKEEEARKNVLRTHTTAVSARMLKDLGQKKPFVPSKFFSIDRVFRNETLDATHLAEFHQVEGVVADRGISLSNLLGLMKAFFNRLGIDQLRFKPAFNPYTEPSMEVFAFHPGLKKWVEVGNSGIFRPEMLLPMGLPPDVSVAAWGLSLERPTMIRYGIDNIRDLVGPKVDLQMVYDNPICRLDKND